MTKLNDSYYAAAKLLAVNPNITKTDVAHMVGVSKTTLYNWLATERFESQIEEYSITPTVMTDPDTLMETLTVEEKEQMIQILSKNEHGISLAEELDQLIAQLAQRIDSIRAPKRRTQVVEEIEKLVGRLEIFYDPQKANIYNEDGSSKPYTLQMLIDLNEEIIELIILSNGFGHDNDPEELDLIKRDIRVLKAGQQIGINPLI